VIALVLWPVIAPVADGLVEPNSRARRLIYALIPIGLVRAIQKLIAKAAVEGLGLPGSFYTRRFDRNRLEAVVSITLVQNIPQISSIVRSRLGQHHRSSTAPALPRPAENSAAGICSRTAV